MPRWLKIALVVLLVPVSLVLMVGIVFAVDRATNDGEILGDVSVYGVFGCGGNVREWTLNAAGENRYNLGGGWSEPSYTYQDSDAASLHPP